MLKREFLRYERKYVLDSYVLNNKEDLESILSINLIEQFNKRRINSIYYDTKNYQFAIDNLEGLSNRQKIRIRYYGLLDEFSSPRLEIKTKLGGVGKKEIFDLNKYELYNDNFSLNQLYKLNLVNRKVLYFLVAIEPKVIVTYQRKYFLSSCERFRLTLDSDISFKKFNINSSYINLNENNFYSFSKKILELKYELKNEPFASQTFKNIPSRISSFSKYLTALNYLGWKGKHDHL